VKPGPAKDAMQSLNGVKLIFNADQNSFPKGKQSCLLDRVIEVFQNFHVVCFSILHVSQTTEVSRSDEDGPTEIPQTPKRASRSIETDHVGNQSKKHKVQVTTDSLNEELANITYSSSNSPNDSESSAGSAYQISRQPEKQSSPNLDSLCLRDVEHAGYSQREVFNSNSNFETTPRATGDAVIRKTPKAKRHQARQELSVLPDVEQIEPIDLSNQPHEHSQKAKVVGPKCRNQMYIPTYSGESPINSISLDGPEMEISPNRRKVLAEFQVVDAKVAKNTRVKQHRKHVGILVRLRPSYHSKVNYSFTVHLKRKFDYKEETIKTILKSIARAHMAKVIVHWVPQNDETYVGYTTKGRKKPFLMVKPV